MNADPIPVDGRNLRAVRRAAEHASHARLVAELVEETGGDLADERAKHRRLPADELTLRGLPAIGPGVAGAIRGTRPGDGLE